MRHEEPGGLGIETIQHNARTAWRTVNWEFGAWRAKGSFIVDRISPKLEQASCLARLGYYFFFAMVSSRLVGSILHSMGLLQARDCEVSCNGRVIGKTFLLPDCYCAGQSVMVLLWKIKWCSRTGGCTASLTHRIAVFSPQTFPRAQTSSKFRTTRASSSPTEPFLIRFDLFISRPCLRYPLEAASSYPPRQIQAPKFYGVSPQPWY